MGGGGGGRHFFDDVKWLHSVSYSHYLLLFLPWHNSSVYIDNSENKILIWWPQLLKSLQVAMDMSMV